jgi:hypothetical protein
MLLKLSNLFFALILQPTVMQFMFYINIVG